MVAPRVPKPPEKAGFRRKILSNPIISGIITALVVSSVVGAWATFRAVVSGRMQQRNPVAMTVDSARGDGWLVALPGSLPEHERLERSGPKDSAVYDWLRERSGVDYRETRLKLSVRGLADERVVIRNIEADVERKAPLNGTLVRSASAGANDATVLLLQLDDPEPVAWEWSEEEERLIRSFPFFQHKNVTVQKGEVHDFLILARTERTYAKWRLVVDVEVAGQRQRIRLPEDGTSFTTSGRPQQGFGSLYEWDWAKTNRFVPWHPLAPL